MIKSPIQFVLSVFQTFLILNVFRCAFLAFCFQVSKTKLFLLGLSVGFVDFKLSFVLRILKLYIFESSQMDYVILMV